MRKLAGSIHFYSLVLSITLTSAAPFSALAAFGSVECMQLFENRSDQSHMPLTIGNLLSGITLPKNNRWAVLNMEPSPNLSNQIRKMRQRVIYQESPTIRYSQGLVYFKNNTPTFVNNYFSRAGVALLLQHRDKTIVALSESGFSDVAEKIADTAVYLVYFFGPERRFTEGRHIDGGSYGRIMTPIDGLGPVIEDGRKDPAPPNMDYAVPNGKTVFFAGKSGPRKGAEHLSPDPHYRSLILLMIDR